MRRFSFCFLLLFIGAIAASKENWWQNGNFYQIYPRSFQDSNADGIGDLNGIISRIDYLKDLGVTGIWLSPIFKSPMKDFGYDISDYLNIQDEYGTELDVSRLAARCKQARIKLILDFVPNHTSNEHEWFIKSEANDPKYRDFYVWRPGKTLANGTIVPPNNWLSTFRGSGWEWSNKRKEFYFHQFLKEQPDLNYRNPVVVQEMKDILRYWLDRGVDGFRIDAVPYLFEDAQFRDEPVSGQCNDKEAACYLKHIYTQDYPETYDMIYQWRNLTDEYSIQHNDDVRILMTEAYTALENTTRFYGDGKRLGAHIPFNFELISNINIQSKAGDIKKNIDNWLNAMPKGPQFKPNWVLGNHDNKRTASRFGPARADLINILLKTLPGVAVTYNGEELALTDVYISWNNTKDPQACRTNPNDFHAVSRDPARTPFQWDDTKNAGFSSANETWLPVASNYTLNNVKLQQSQQNSNLKVFKRLIRFRRHPTLAHGEMNLKAIDDDLLVYTRTIPNDTNADKFVVVLNLGLATKPVNLKTLFTELPQKLQVAVTSSNSKLLKNGDVVDASAVKAEGQIGTLFVGIARSLNDDDIVE